MSYDLKLKFLFNFLRLYPFQRFETKLRGVYLICPSGGGMCKDI